MKKFKYNRNPSIYTRILLIIFFFGLGIFMELAPPNTFPSRSGIYYVTQVIVRFWGLISIVMALYGLAILITLLRRKK